MATQLDIFSVEMASRITKKRIGYKMSYALIVTHKPAFYRGLRLQVFLSLDDPRRASGYGGHRETRKLFASLPSRKGLVGNDQVMHFPVLPMPFSKQHINLLIVSIFLLF